MAGTPEHHRTSGNPIRIRTCIATRKRMSDVDMLRVVLDPLLPQTVIPDPGRCLPGRGAWITPTLQALDLAEARRAFSRALRVSAPVDTGPVREFLTGHTEHQPRKTEH
ncbi:MAG: YlxR family protein [Corynebacterium sp.]|nr:YlxR family protein [Corynebacterium sp.]